MARAITSEEQVLVEAPSQASKLFVAIHKPAVIMAARVNQTIFDPTGVIDITYDGVTAGSWANILPGMTIYVGSAAGLYDLGMARVRKQPTSSVLYIGRDGETLWADNAYLTVVDDFDFWAKHWFSTNETDLNFMMDQDIVYAGQNANPYPVVVMGPDVVLNIDPYTITGDERHTIVSLSLTGLTLANTDNGKLYVSMFYYITNNQSIFFFHKDAARTYEVVRSLFVSNNGGSVNMGYSGVGIGGSMVAGVLTAPNDQDIVVSGLFGNTVQFTPNASNSWVLGSSISTYAWNAVGASNVANGTTATPTITYNTANVDGYRLSCTITAANGSVSVGHRVVFVFDAAHPPKTIALDSCVGSWQDSGWMFSGTIHINNLSDIRDRARCVLFARDYYNNLPTPQSIGPLAGYKNILMCGRIDVESIEWNPKYSTVKFTAHGPAWWIQQLTGSPTRLGNSTGVPTMWIEFQDMTVDAVIHNLLYWRSTVMSVIDVYPPNDDRPVNNLNSTPGSIWGQLTSMSDNHILTHSACDRYGRLFIQIDTQFLQLGVRDAPVVMAIGKADWRDAIKIERRPVHVVGSLEASGAADSTTEYFFSRAAGKIYGRYGAVEPRDNLLVHDQADLNQICGMIYAWRNNMYPTVEIPLVGNNRMVDIVPVQRVTLSIEASDTPRGIVWTDKLLLPRRVEFAHDPEKGILQVDLECEAETSGLPGITIIPPGPGTYPRNRYPPRTPPNPPIVPGYGYPPPPPYKPPPPNIEPTICTTDVYPPNGPYNLGLSGDMYSDDIYEWSAEFAATLRGNTQHYLSRYVLSGSFERFVDGSWEATSTDDWYDVVAVLADYDTELVAIHDAVVGDGKVRTGYWNIPNNTKIRKVKIVMKGDAAFTCTNLVARDAIYNWGTNCNIVVQEHVQEFVNGAFHWNTYATWTADQDGAHPWARIQSGFSATILIAPFHVRGSVVLASGGHVYSRFTFDPDDPSNWGIGNYARGYPYPHYYLTFTSGSAPQYTLDEIVNYSPGGIGGAESAVFFETFQLAQALALPGTVSGAIYTDFYITNAAGYRIRINSLLLYNICP